ncbi:ROK family protein [Rhodobacteraceae bacterium CCMM004]|nr:ROK family protein [Rhodobacteraceae bacterium CCMM004]
MRRYRQLTDDGPLSENARGLMAVVMRQGDLPRSEITQHTNLSQQSVHRITDALLGRGLLRLRKPTISGPGKPSPRVAIDPDAHVSFGLSVGTGQVTACALALTGAPIAESPVDADPNDPAAVRDTFLDLVAEWMDGTTSGRRCVGIGVAMQGYREGHADVFFPPGPLDRWRGLSLTEFLGRGTHLQTFVENNATSSAIAEHYLGAGPDQGSLAYLSFNYGFGVGLFIDGNPFIGSHGNAGEISAIFSPEQSALRPALQSLIPRLAPEGAPRHRAFQAVIGAVPASDPRVESWVAEVRPQLHLALRTLKAVADPSVVVFGGEAPDTLRQRLIEASEGAFAGQTTPNPMLTASAIAGDPAHLGAAFLPLHRLVY